MSDQTDMGLVFDEPTARRLLQAALARDLCADLLNCIEQGGAVTIDGRTGELVCISGDALQDLLRNAD